MSLYSIKLRIASILAGIAIAFLATFIILGVLAYFFGIAVTSNLIFLILILFTPRIIRLKIKLIATRPMATKKILPLLPLRPPPEKRIE